MPKTREKNKGPKLRHWAAPLVNLDEREPELMSQLFFLLVFTQAVKPGHAGTNASLEAGPRMPRQHSVGEISKISPIVRRP